MDSKTNCKNWRPIGPFPSLAAAARNVGIHRSTISGRLRRGWSDCDAINIPVGTNPYLNSKKWPMYRKAWLREQSKAKALREQGMTYKVIAKVLGCSASKVSDLLNRKTSAYS